MKELREYLIFLGDYFATKAKNFGHNFEKLKDLIVAFLVVKRGKYSTSFLNTSFLLLIATTFIAGPIIIQNNPFVPTFAQQSFNGQAPILSYDPYDNALSTIISVKPRDKIVTHTVSSGETLASIAKRYGISVDTIKWENNLKSDTIKPADNLQIPPITGVVHKVIAGENIYTIATKFKTSAQAIVNFPFNDFTDLDTFGLRSGQTLYVPNGIIEEAQPTYQQSFAQVQSGVKGSSSFIWPTTGVITQYPVWYHMALDIANPSQPPVIAADTGTIVYSGCISSGYGCHIIIDHANGYRTLYGHLSQLTTTAGQAVNKGQLIGYMGSTGRSSGTHLHFEVRSGETLMNPLSFLK